MPLKVGPFRPGQPVFAADMEAMRKEILRLGNFMAAAPMRVSSDPVGVTIRVDLPQDYPIKLTSHGTGGKYAWTLQKANSTGFWVDHPSGLTGTTAVDPATEINGDTMISTSTPPIVLAWRDPNSGVLFFQSQSC